MNNSYNITEINIRRAPGYDKIKYPPVTDLESQLNVIWGPNGIGKTTLAKAMRLLIWKNNEIKGFEVDGIIKNNNNIYSAYNFDNQLNQTNLETNKEETLKGRIDDLNDIYWLSLTSFLIANSAKDFHQIIYKELSGGVDLTKAFDEAGGNFTTPRSLSINFRNARDRLNEVRKNQGKVESLTSQIASLEKKIASEVQLKEELAEIEKALEYLNLKNELTNLEITLDNYDKRLEKIEKHHWNEYLSFSQFIKEKEEEQQLLSSNIDNSIKNLKATFITKEQLENLSLSTSLKNCIEDLKENSRKLESALEQLDNSKGRLEEFQKQYQFLLKENPKLSEIENSLETLRELSLSIEPIRSNLSAQEKLVELLGPMEEISLDKEKLAKLRYLIDEAFLKEDSPNNIWFIVVAVIGIIAAILSIVITPFLSLISLASLLTVTLLKRDSSELLDSTLRKRIEKLTQELSITDFDNLNKQNLIKLLREVDSLISEAELNEKKIAQIKKLESEKEKLSNWVEKNSEASKKLNIDSSSAQLDGQHFYYFGNSLVTYTKHLEEVSEKESLYDTAKKNLDYAIKKLQAISGSEQTEITDLISEAGSLLERLNRAISISSEIEKLKNDLELAEKSLDTKKEDLNLFLNGIEIELAKIHLLEEFVQQKDQWDELNREYKQISKSLLEIEEKYTKSVELVNSFSIIELEIKKETQQQLIAEIGDAREELGEKKSLYNSLIEGSVYAEAQNNYQKALDALEQLRLDEVESRTVQLLFNHLEESSQQSANSEILQRAVYWFDKITSNKYHLKINNNDFFAYDNTTQRNYNFDQLSDGNRIQLIFAIKMAFIETQEASSGMKFPIFMDELLANSDDKRSLAIIEAIREIAKERQVFYFTAQADEVEKFKNYASDVFNEISLQALWADNEKVSPLIPFTDYSEKLEVLADYNSYLDILSIPKPSLFDPIENTHLFYLFTESNLLIKNINKNIEKIGQLKETYKEIDLLREAQQLGLIGRTKKLSLSDLDDSEIEFNKSSAYYKEISEVLKESSNSGNALVEALESRRIKRFNDREELISFLVNNGYSTTEQSLSVNEILNSLGLEKESSSYFIVKRYLENIIT